MGCEWVRGWTRGEPRRLAKAARLREVDLRVDFGDGDLSTHDILREATAAHEMVQSLSLGVLVPKVSDFRNRLKIADSAVSLTEAMRS